MNSNQLDSPNVLNTTEEIPYKIKANRIQKFFKFLRRSNKVIIVKASRIAVMFGDYQCSQAACNSLQKMHVNLNIERAWEKTEG